MAGALSDAAIVVATLAGPMLAIQAQKWLERGRSIHERRSTIFRVLMATRAARLSPGHVEALNAIQVEFYGPKKPKLKAITDAWRGYLDLLSDHSLSPEVSAVKRGDAFIDLLHMIANFLRYDFSRSEIATNFYYPTGHANIETEQDTIRRGVAMLFKGEASIPMSVTDFPTDPEAVERQENLQKLLLEWLEGQRAVKISNEGKR